MHAHSNDSSLDWGHSRVPNTPYHLFRPNVPQGTNAPGPQFVLLCSWTDASPRHIAKYLDAYRSMYPTSTILLAQTKTVDFFRSQTSLLQMTKPAVRLIQSEIGAEASLLAHALSNGGSGHLTCIARQYHDVTGRPLPINALILDSTPTKPDFRSLFVSLSIPLPPSLFVRLPLQTLIGALLFFSYVLPRWMGMTNMGDRVYDDLNNSDMTADGSGGTREWLRHKAPRTYIYSDTDDICPAYSIEAHFQQALLRGLNVRREMWSGSGHVAHMKVDPERYWSVVRRAWEESQ